MDAVLFSSWGSTLLNAAWGCTSSTHDVFVFRHLVLCACEYVYPDPVLEVLRFGTLLVRFVVNYTF